MHTHRHIHAHTDPHRHAHAHTRQREPGLPPCRWPQLPRAACPSHTPHWYTPPSSLVCIIVHPLGVWPSHGQTLVGDAQVPTPPGGVAGPRAGYKHEGKGRAGRQEGWRGRACVSQQAGSERPLLAGSRLSHLAEQRQWWLPGGPAFFPQAEPRVLECPVNSPAGTQPQGAQGGFPERVARAPRNKLGQGRGP